MGKPLLVQVKTGLSCGISVIKLLRTLSGHSDAVRTVAIGPDGQTASGSWDKTIKVWNLHNGAITHSIWTHKPGSYYRYQPRWADPDQWQ